MIEFNFTCDLEKGRPAHAHPLNELIKVAINPLPMLPSPYNQRLLYKHIILSTKFYIGVKDYRMIQSLLS